MRSCKRLSRPGARPTERDHSMGQIRTIQIIISSSVFISTAHVPTIANSSEMIRSEDLGDFINVYRAKDPRVRIQLRSMTQLKSSQTEILLLAQTNGKVKESSKPAFRSGPTNIDNYFSQGTYSATGTDVDQLSNRAQ